jgi:hypothetical protein
MTMSVLGLCAGGGFHPGLQARILARKHRSGQQHMLAVIYRRQLTSARQQQLQRMPGTAEQDCSHWVLAEQPAAAAAAASH